MSPGEREREKERRMEDQRVGVEGSERISVQMLGTYKLEGSAGPRVKAVVVGGEEQLGQARKARDDAWHQRREGKEKRATEKSWRGRGEDMEGEGMEKGGE